MSEQGDSGQQGKSPDIYAKLGITRATEQQSIKTAEQRIQEGFEKGAGHGPGPASDANKRSGGRWG